MTDYGQFYENLEERKERQRKEKEAREKAERKKVDKAFEQVILKPKVKKAKKICSSNSDLIKFIKHVKNVKAALKQADADGFCLDEIMDGLKELGNE